MENIKKKSRIDRDYFSSIDMTQMRAKFKDGRTINSELKLRNLKEKINHQKKKKNRKVIAAQVSKKKRKSGI